MSLWAVKRPMVHLLAALKVLAHGEHHMASTALFNHKLDGKRQRWHNLLKFTHLFPAHGGGTWEEDLALQIRNPCRTSFEGLALAACFMRRTSYLQRLPFHRGAVSHPDHRQNSPPAGKPGPLTSAG